MDQAEAPRPSGKRVPLVLIVDDEEWMRDACSLIVRKEGLEALTADNAKLGLELCAGHGPDVVIADVRMPVMDGLEFVRRVKAFDPDMVVLVITGYATVTMAVEAMKAGADEFLTKPFEPSEFRAALRRGLEQRAAATTLLSPGACTPRSMPVAVLAHQLKSPLVAVRQCLDVVMHGYLGEVPAKAAGMIEVAATRTEQMLLLINNWVTLLRLQEGATKLEFHPLELNQLVGSLVSILGTGPEGDRPALLFEPCPAPLEVQGDDHTLKEALSNLVMNALRYTQGGGHVRVRVERRCDSAVVQIADDGPGIPPENLERIFEPFFRGKAQKGIPGDGLGLPIVQTICRAHGGEVTVSSQPGQGACFEVRLPVCSETRPPHAPEAPLKET